MKIFKELTLGHCIIMGRKTFESIGKPLPGRHNIVVSNGKIEREGCLQAVDLNHALEMAREMNEKEAFIIGGGQIYSYAMDLADKLYISHVDHSFPNADTFFPSIPEEEWKLSDSKPYHKNEKNEYAFEFKVYRRV